MGKFSRLMKKKYKETNKKSIVIYLILRLLVILSMIFQIILGNISNVLMCILALMLFTLPTIISEKFKIGIPSLLEGIIYLFIYSTAILGEINNFYGRIPFWDTILHTLNGFLCAGIGLSLVDLLNQNSKRIKLSPLYIAIVAFCFSMTIGILWEFFEFSADYLTKTDMQKDRIVREISSVMLNKDNENVPIKVKDIEKTEIYSKDGTVTTIENGYLDIGLIDTMKDLFVNFIGAVVFSIIGFFHVQNREKYKFAEGFIPTKDEKTKEKIEFNSLIPELSVSNIENSKRFYENLGFKIIYERIEDKFCFMQLEDNQIMIEEQNNNWNVGKLEYPYGNGINISMSINDVEKLYGDLKLKQVKLFMDLKVNEYRVDNVVFQDKEFLVQDPDGYLLRFND